MPNKKFIIKPWNICFIFWIVAGSCSKDPLDYSPTIAPSETRLCMSGFVSTDSIYVVLTKNLPRTTQFNGRDLFQIDDTTGTVEVYENGVFFCKLSPKSYLFNAGGGNIYAKFYYTSYKMATEGNTYTIKASHKDYESISADTYMPYKIPVASVDTVNYYKHELLYREITETQEGGGTIILGYEQVDTTILYTQYAFNFQDPPTTKNYYMVRAYNISENRVSEIFLDDPIIELKNVDCLFSDNLIQGKEYGFKCVVAARSNNKIRFELYSINSDHFKYYSSIKNLYSDDNYQKYQEPTTIYFNVKNGYGIISAYSRVSYLWE